MIHEALHLFSLAYTKQEYMLARGWEEGVVEQLQRLLRQEVFAALKIVVSEEIFTERDVAHEYNRYIRALEGLRELLELDAREFYLWLLATPLSERLSAVEAKGDMMPPTQRAQFRRTLMLAQGVLGRA